MSIEGVFHLPNAGPEGYAVAPKDFCHPTIVSLLRLGIERVKLLSSKDVRRRIDILFSIRRREVFG